MYRLCVSCDLRGVALYANRCTCLQRYLILLRVVLKATNSELWRCCHVLSSCIDIRSAQLIIRVHVCRPGLHLLQHIYHQQRRAPRPNLCSVFARTLTLSLMHLLLAYSSFLSYVHPSVLSILRAISYKLLLPFLLKDHRFPTDLATSCVKYWRN